MDIVGAHEPGTGDHVERHLVERTGEPAVDEVLDRLEALAPTSPPAQQADVLEEVHDRLERRLSGAQR